MNGTEPDPPGAGSSGLGSGAGAGVTAPPPAPRIEIVTLPPEGKLRATLVVVPPQPVHDSVDIAKPATPGTSTARLWLSWLATVRATASAFVHERLLASTSTILAPLAAGRPFVLHETAAERPAASAGEHVTAITSAAARGARITAKKVAGRVRRPL